MLSVATRHDLGLDAYRRVAWAGEAVRLADEATDAMRAAHRSFHALVASDPTISVYGLTTAGGEYARERITPEQRRELEEERRVASHRGRFNLALAVGEPLPERVTRGFVLARLANFVGGHAAVRPELGRAVAELLDGRQLPPVPRSGQGGAGEILPLGHLLGHLMPLAADGKESNALVNGSPCAAALVADAALAARARLEVAADVFALSAEAIEAPLDNYGPALDALWGDPDDAAALAGLRARLEGAGAKRREYQTPVSWRILPRVLGQAHRAVRTAEEVARTSLAAVTDNPVYVPPDADHPLGQVFSTGGYHNAAAAPALDGLAAAWADLCLLAERHCSALVDGNVSLLPDKLAVGEVSPFYLCFVALGVGEEARRAAQRTFLPPSSGGFAQNDVASPNFWAWESEQRAAASAEVALAVLAALASQALFVTGRPAPPPLRPFLAAVRRAFPPLVDPRPLGADVDALAAAFRERAYAPG